ESRSTKTWSPTRSVCTMDSDGISNACTIKVMMNKPDTRTAAIPAMDSERLSFFFSGFLSLLLANKLVFLLRVFKINEPDETCGPTGPVAAGGPGFVLNE